MLNEFVVQYDKAVQTRRESEEREDFQTMNTQATLSGRHPIEKAAGDRYTRRVFRKFQAEFIASNNCTHATLNKDGCSGWYRVGHVDEDQRRWKVVQYTAYDDPFVRCSCALFETAGILCQHALYIMRKKKVVVLPEQFILSRWTLSVRYSIGQSSAEASQSTEQASVPMTLDLWNLRAKLGKVYEDAKEDPDDVTTVSSFYDQFLEKASLRRYSQTSMESTNYAPTRSTEWISELDVRDPVGPVRTKGHPRIATRIRSGIETSNEIRRKRSCGYCGEQGHISTGCGKRKLSAQSLRDEQD